MVILQIKKRQRALQQLKYKLIKEEYPFGRNNLFLKIASVAATFILLVTVLTLFYKSTLKRQENKIIYTAIFEEPKIIDSVNINIDLSNNKTIVISENTNNLIEQEEDGTSLKIDNSESITYQSDSTANKEKNIYNTLYVPAGKKFSICLADGTQVFLNSQSTIKYPVTFTENTREVLLSGQAYFIVKK